MKTNTPAFQTAGLVLLLVATVALKQTTPSTLANEGLKADGVAPGREAVGSSLLPGNRTHLALAAADKLDRYAAAAGSMPSTNGLVGWWKLDETEGTVASDSSGNGHHGT